MNVARLLYPVRTLGPGQRMGIWLSGCHRRCRGCSNPELWQEREEYRISVPELFDFVSGFAAEHPTDGFTITGGEPLNQADELSDFLDRIREISQDILLYTGYTVEELRKEAAGKRMDCIRKAAVIVDGPYIEELNRGQKMRGSANQRIIIVNRQYEGIYRRYLSEGSLEIQNFIGERSLYSVGIHRNDFAEGMKRVIGNMREEYETHE